MIYKISFAIRLFPLKKINGDFKNFDKENLKWKTLYNYLVTFIRDYFTILLI